MNCSTCGKALVGEKDGGYRWHHVLEVENIRPLYSGRREKYPQILVNLTIYRNGGPDDPVCDDCIVAALQKVQEHLTEVLSPAVMIDAQVK